MGVGAHMRCCPCACAWRQSNVSAHARTACACVLAHAQVFVRACVVWRVRACVRASMRLRPMWQTVHRRTELNENLDLLQGARARARAHARAHVQIAQTRARALARQAFRSLPHARTHTRTLPHAHMHTHTHTHTRARTRTRSAGKLEEVQRVAWLSHVGLDEQQRTHTHAHTHARTHTHTRTRTQGSRGSRRCRAHSATARRKSTCSSRQRQQRLQHRQPLCNVFITAATAVPLRADCTDCTGNTDCTRCRERNSSADLTRLTPSRSPRRVCVRACVPARACPCVRIVLRECVRACGCVRACMHASCAARSRTCALA